MLISKTKSWERQDGRRTFWEARKDLQKQCLILGESEFTCLSMDDLNCW
ncbi:MAG: hypothetical protein AAGB31_16080 [Bdellovibrio sp.]